MTSLLQHLLSVPAWMVLSFVGLLVFAEDALFLGFVFPGETAALVAGVAAELGHIPLWAAIGVTVVAAIAGDTVGYEVGRHLGPSILSSRFLRRHRDGLDRAQSLLARRGGLAVFLGRWVALLRALMPALAGAARMPYRRFAVWNMIGGAAWGLAAVSTGYLAGASYDRIGRAVDQGGAAMFAALVVAGLVARHVVRRRRDEMGRRPAGSGAEERPLVNR
jgi:membrane-associated protein